jgi:hypothetical protein
MTDNDRVFKGLAHRSGREKIAAIGTEPEDQK